MNEADILARCVNQINALPGVQAELRTTEVARLNRRLDAEVTIRHDGRRWDCILEIQKNMTGPIARHFRNTIVHQTLPQETLIICADYVRETAANELMYQGVNYVDAVGNMFLNLPEGPYVIMTGKKPVNIAGKEPGLLFQPTGIKIIYLLLLLPDALNWTYREIAKAAGVARGSVGWVFTDLKKDGYVQLVSKNARKLVERQKLLDRWLGGYTEKLRPKLIRGRYRAREMDFGVLLRNAGNVFKDYHVNWAATGTQAADLLIHHYQGDELVLFVDEWNLELEAALGWLPDADGPITILEAFGDRVIDKTINNTPITTPLLTYAELLVLRNERARETADILFRKLIQETFSED